DPPGPPLFPYTTLFRSPTGDHGMEQQKRRNGGEPASSCRKSLATAARSWLALRPPRPRTSSPWTPTCLTDRCSWKSSGGGATRRSEEHTSELQSRFDLV